MAGRLAVEAEFEREASGYGVSVQLAPSRPIRVDIIMNPGPHPHPSRDQT